MININKRRNAIILRADFTLYIHAKFHWNQNFRVGNVPSLICKFVFFFLLVVVLYWSILCCMILDRRHEFGCPRSEKVDSSSKRRLVVPAKVLNSERASIIFYPIVPSPDKLHYGVILLTLSYLYVSFLLQWRHVAISICHRWIKNHVFLFSC